MFEWLKPKKKEDPIKEVPNSDDTFLYSTQLSLTHSDGSAINITIQGKKAEYISYISERISSLFKISCDSEKIKAEYEKFSQDLDIQSKKCWEEFEKMFEQLNKGPK